jgi:hypothetical protein
MTSNTSEPADIVAETVPAKAPATAPSAVASAVASAVDDSQTQHVASPPAAQRPRGHALEVTAVVMLTFGSVIPVFGWAVGVVLLWSSSRWHAWEKTMGTVVGPGGPGLALWLGPAAVALPRAVGVPLLLFMVFGPMIVSVVLLARAWGRSPRVG